MMGLVGDCSLVLGNKSRSCTEMVLEQIRRPIMIDKVKLSRAFTLDCLNGALLGLSVIPFIVQSLKILQCFYAIILKDMTWRFLKNARVPHVLRNFPRPCHV